MVPHSFHQFFLSHPVLDQSSAWGMETYHNKYSRRKVLCNFVSYLLPRTLVHRVVSEVLTGRIVSGYHSVICLGHCLYLKNANLMLIEHGKNGLVYFKCSLHIITLCKAQKAPGTNTNRINEFQIPIDQCSQSKMPVSQPPTILYAEYMFKTHLSQRDLSHRGEVVTVMEQRNRIHDWKILILGPISNLTGIS